MSRTKLVANNLVKRFGEGASTVTALDGLDLSVAEGEFVCILGPSGCGKSTLLFMVAGLEQPTSGEISVDGKPVTGPGRERGMLFQQFALFPWRTARQNIEFGLEIQSIGKAARWELTKHWLALMKLSEFANLYPHQLSGGMQQRIAIARLLINDPEVLLMDEPFAALDAQTRSLLGEELVRVWQRTRRTVLFVTHSVDEAVYLADRLLVMTKRPGRFKADLRINLPRPRDPAADEFNSIRREVTRLIRSEVTDSDASNEILDVSAKA
jgi:NitT/TauT family transport system ATP-binding protein